MSSNDLGKTPAVRIVDRGIETIDILRGAGVRLRFDLDDLALADDAGELLEILAEYFSGCAGLAAGEKIDWASSLLVAQQRSTTCISFGDLDFDGTTILTNVDRAIRIWNAQSAICGAQEVELCPTRFGDMVAFSPGVLDSDQPLEGIRYDTAGVMSGWWIFTSDYDGTLDEFSSMRPKHVFELLRARPGVAKFLGLPRGYAFRMSPHERVWFEGVADAGAKK